ncbi:MAG: zinc-dependent metalloprotease [Saprospiraceae bacterium]
MKTYKCFIIIGLLLFSYSISSGQDLIERTRKGISPQIEKVKPNVLNQKIQAIAPDQFSPYTVFEYAISNDFRSLENNVKLEKAAFMTMQATAIEQILAEAPQALTLRIPVSAFQSVRIKLSETKVLSDDFVLQTNTGKTLFAEDFAGLFYSGVVEDDPTAIAFFSISESGIRGIVSDQYGNYNLGPIDQGGHYIFYPDREKKLEKPVICDTPDDPVSYDFPLNEEQTSRAKAKENENCVKVYVECDFAMYNANGASLGGVFDYVTSLFAGVVTVYAIENIPVELTEIFVWESDDPYSGGDNTSDVLDAFVAERTSFNGNLAHLLTTRSIGGGKAKGIGGICSDSGALPYAVSGGLGNTSVPAFPTDSWDLMVFTHEMGHNMGSRHTQACVWNGDNTQIDDCGNLALTTDGEDNDDDGDIDEADEAEGDGCYDNTAPIIPASGTIMSYCHLVNQINLVNGFGPQPGSVIRESYSNGGCLSKCNCLTADRNLPGVISQGVYAAGHSITSNGQVLANSIVNFKAGSFIDLTEGFRAESGSFFQAEIEACSVAGGSGGGSLVSSFFNDLQEEKIAVSSPLRFSIFPNPASERLTVTYSLPETSNVSIHLLDIAGRLIETIEQDMPKEAGDHQLPLSVNAFKAGTYLCVLKTDTTFKTIRFVVVR